MRSRRHHRGARFTVRAPRGVSPKRYDGAPTSGPGAPGVGMLPAGDQSPDALEESPHLRSGLAFVLTSMFVVQGGNALADSLLHRIDAIGLTSLRLGFGAASLLVVVRPRIRGRTRSELRAVLGFGMLLAVQTIVFLQALSRLPLAVVVTVSLLGPLTVAARNSRRRADLLWPALALGGVVLIAQLGGGGGPPVTALGLAFALGAAACWGTYIVVAANIAARFGGLDGLALAAPVAGLIAIAIGVPISGGQMTHGSVLLLGAIVGILTFGITYAFETQALRRLPKRVFGVLASLEPAIATVEGFVFLGQRPSVGEGFGILLVILASAGASIPWGPRGVRQRPSVSEGCSDGERKP